MTRPRPASPRRARGSADGGRRDGPRRSVPAWLALEDGSVFAGTSFGAEGETGGETIFNTGMAGYQEVLTDPSYKGQIVVMTPSHVGNYGINPEDGESERPHVEGFVVREACWTPSNWRSRESLPDFLRRFGIVGIEGVDTRALVILLRSKGALRGVISTREQRPAALAAKARAVPPIEDRDLVQEVSTRAVRAWEEGVGRLGEAGAGRREAQLELGAHAEPHHAVVVDCGVKWNILRSLVTAGCRVTVVPAFTDAARILALKPDGVVFSNGPGDPDRLPRLCATVQALAGKIPVFGICLGHQVIGKAFGGKVFKLKFGHHGVNQPVRHEPTGRVAITVQNHNFAVDAATLPPEVEVTHLNLNDRTVEGLRHRALPVFSVQYHPECCPGPHDAQGHFQEFTAMMTAAKGRG